MNTQSLMLAWLARLKSTSPAGNTTFDSSVMQSRVLKFAFYQYIFEVLRFFCFT